MRSRMACLFGVLGACAGMTTTQPSAACQPDEGWLLLLEANESHPVNAAVLVSGSVSPSLGALNDEEPADLVPARFPYGDASFFVSPLPSPGDVVFITAGDCEDTDCAVRHFTMDEPDHVGPALTSPLYYDLHDYPGHDDDGDCGGGGPRDMSYFVRFDVADGGSRKGDFAFIELRDRDGRLLRRVVRRVFPGYEYEIAMGDAELGAARPDEVCITVQLTDLAGNALEPVTSCAPCHVAETATGEVPDWSDNTLHPSGVCDTPMPAEERLPGMADLPAVAQPSGCSFAPAQRAAHERFLAALAMLFLAQRRRRPQLKRSA